MTLVIDNSVALAWCFQDERTPALMAVLDRVEAGGAVAPQLWPLEASNALLVAERRGRISADDRTGLLRFLANLPITIDSETATQAWTGTAALAERHGLTAYDAAYLELALRLDLPLATRDRALVRAAEALGVEVSPPAEARDRADRRDRPVQALADHDRQAPDHPPQQDRRRDRTAGRGFAQDGVLGAGLTSPPTGGRGRGW